MVLHCTTILRPVRPFYRDYLNELRSNGVWKLDILYIIDVSCYLTVCYYTRSGHNSLVSNEIVVPVVEPIRLRVEASRPHVERLSDMLGTILGLKSHYFSLLY